MITSPACNKLLALALGLLLAGSVMANTGELWRGAVAGAHCQLELVNELGGVQATSGSTMTPVVKVQGDSGLLIEELTPGPVLSVARTGPPGDGTNDVEITVPPGCRLNIRTTHGDVSLEINRTAVPAVVNTLSGDITAWIHPETDALVSFATSGQITTDFTIEIEYRYHANAWKHGQISHNAQNLSENDRAAVSLNTNVGGVLMLRQIGKPSTPADWVIHDD